MRTIKTKYTLFSDNLEIQPDVEIILDDHNTIISLDEHREKSNIVAIPGFFNAHIHAADIGLRGNIGTDLHQVVGPNGIKQKYLKSLTNDGLELNLRKCIIEGRKNGILGFADFREGGLKGIEPYNNILPTYIPFARPRKDEFSRSASFNVGIRDVVAYQLDSLKKLSELVHNGGKRVEIHASEDIKLRKKWIGEFGVSDIIWSIDELRPHAIVHATHADETDIEMLKTTKTGVILCPTSNQYFRVGNPPIYKLIENNVTLALGSDNAMVNPISLWQEIDWLREKNIPSRMIIQMATVNGAKLSGVNWGISKNNSNFLLIEIPENIKEDELLLYLTSPTSRNHIVENIYSKTNVTYN